jgi:hypothetical protein
LKNIVWVPSQQAFSVGELVPGASVVPGRSACLMQVQAVICNDATPCSCAPSSTHVRSSNKFMQCCVREQRGLLRMAAVQHTARRHMTQQLACLRLSACSINVLARGHVQCAHRTETLSESSRHSPVTRLSEQNGRTHNMISASSLASATGVGGYTTQARYAPLGRLA